MGQSIWYNYEQAVISLAVGNTNYGKITVEIIKIETGNHSLPVMKWKA
jgi:hypothetical protein